MQMQPVPDNSGMHHNPTESLIEYPCDFPIKVMGKKVDGFVEAITSVAVSFDAGFEASRLELRNSKGGNYQSLTLTIRATSRAQLDGLYRALSSHPLVKIVL
jgi:putative lipoic acid-binding regulatory protein